MEKNACPRAESCDPTVKVSSRCHMKPLLLWAVGRREGSAIRSNHRCEEVETPYAKQTLELQRMKERSFCKSHIVHFSAELGNPLSTASMSNSSFGSKPFLPKGKGHTADRLGVSASARATPGLAHPSQQQEALGPAQPVQGAVALLRCTLK